MVWGMRGAGALHGYADGGMIQNGYNNFASPNQGNPPVLSQQTPQVINSGGPDLGGSYAGSNMGFDNSGSDGGVGGQPTQMQTPLQPRSFADGGFLNQMASAPMQSGLASLGQAGGNMWGGQQAPAGGFGQVGNALQNLGQQFNQPQAPFSPTQGGQNMNLQGGSQFNPGMQTGLWAGPSNQLTQQPQQPQNPYA